MPADGMPVRWQLRQHISCSKESKLPSRTLTRPAVKRCHWACSDLSKEALHNLQQTKLLVLVSTWELSNRFCPTVVHFLLLSALSYSVPPAFFYHVGKKKKRSHVAKRAICPAEKGRKSTWQSSDQTKCTLLWGLLNLPVCNMLRCFVQGCIWLLT